MPFPFPEYWVFQMIQIQKINTKLCAFLATALLAISAPSHAENKVVDILPPITHANTNEVEDIGEATHPIIRLTPDKSELIHLNDSASSIIIGNPAHISVIADSAKLIVVIPKEPGATHFTVLGKNGQIIMQRHVIVASPKKDYLRIKRTCSGDDEGCQNTSIFYCPDMCHEIRSTEGTKSSSSDTTAKDGANSASNNNSAAAPDAETE